MNRIVLAVFCLLTPVGAFAGSTPIQGTVHDSSGALVPGAHVALFSPVGLLAERVTGGDGAFHFESPASDVSQLVVTADGFATKQIPIPQAGAIEIQLDVAPVVDSVRVTGSTIDVPASQQASSVSVISNAELRQRNEAEAVDLLRTLPGVAVFQAGQRGALTTLSIRGSSSSYELVELDGVPLNSFGYGGSFDLAQIPADFLDRVELVRGAQSALYGSYANSGVINFVSRSGASGTAIDLIGEGGSNDERRFSVSGSGQLHGWGLGLSASSIEDNGEVRNADWRNQNVLAHINRNWQRQSFSASGIFNSNAEGTPGPYGSDPLGLYGGLDLISRNKNNVSVYDFHYQNDLTSRLRGEVFGGFYLANGFYISPFGDSFNKDIRGQGEARLVASIARNWTMSAGVAWAREEVKNTFITDNSFREFPLRRDEEGIYWENRFQFKRLYIQAGVRGEIFNTPTIPAFNDGFTNRPEDPAHTDSRVNPKVAAAYLITNALRVHASVGTGIRPPGGFELAFTTNPDLKPERNTSVDAGLSQTLFNGHVVLDGTFFYNRFSDLIVSLGGDLSRLSNYTSANLANARSRGAEFSGQVRPARWISFSANYTYLDTEVLKLNHADVAQNYYTVGQQLPRQPPHAGSFTLGLSKGRFSGNFIGYVRGTDLDVEPNFGASSGFFPNSGYAYLAVNLNVAVAHGVTVYGTLRNALNEHYEEAYGFPAQRLNFVSGMKWSWRGKD